MTDKQYRELIEQNIYSVDDYVYFLAHSRYESIHHYAWLQLMGLYETWDMSE